MSSSTADRVLGLMELFLGTRSEWTVEAAAAELELPVSTVYRYFRSLSASGFIHAYVPGRYVIGPAIIQFDRQLRHNDPLLRAAAGPIEQLSEGLQSPAVIMLARHYHEQVMCVYQRRVGNWLLPVSYERGRLLPMQRGAAGKVILAALGSRGLEKLGLDAAESSALKQELKLIRRQGYAMTAGELDEGVRGLSLTVRGAASGLIGSLSLIVSDSIEDCAGLLPLLIECRDAVEAGLDA